MRLQTRGRRLDSVAMRTRLRRPSRQRSPLPPRSPAASSGEAPVPVHRWCVPHRGSGPGWSRVTLPNRATVETRAAVCRGTWRCPEFHTKLAMVPEGAGPHPQGTGRRISYRNSAAGTGDLREFRYCTPRTEPSRALPPTASTRGTSCGYVLWLDENGRPGASGDPERVRARLRRRRRARPRAGDRPSQVRCWRGPPKQCVAARPIGGRRAFLHFHTSRSALRRRTGVAPS